MNPFGLIIAAIGVLLVAVGWKQRSGQPATVSPGPTGAAAQGAVKSTGTTGSASGTGTKAGTALNEFHTLKAAKAYEKQLLTQKGIGPGVNQSSFVIVKNPNGTYSVLANG